MEYNDYVIISAIKYGKIERFKKSFEELEVFIKHLLKNDSIVISEQYREYENNGDVCKLGLDVYIPRRIDCLSIPLAYNSIIKSEYDIFGGSKKIYNYHSFDNDFDCYDESCAKECRITASILEELVVDDEIFSRAEEFINNIKNNVNFSENEDRLLEIINKGKNISNVFLYFIKEKLRLLSEEESKMFKCYREFDLERLLIGNLNKYPLNNDNSGLISIFEDKFYKTTVTKIAHVEECKYHLMSYGYNIDNSFSMLSAPLNYNVLLIRIFKKTLVIYSPSELNSFQKENLLLVLQQVKTICECSGMDIEVYLDSFSHEKDYSIIVDDVIEFVEKIKVKAK